MDPIPFALRLFVLNNQWCQRIVIIVNGVEKLCLTEELVAGTKRADISEHFLLCGFVCITTLLDVDAFCRE